MVGNGDLSPSNSADIIAIRRKINETFGSYERGENIEQLTSLVKSIENNPKEVGLYIDTQLDRISEMSGNASDDDITTIYFETLEKINEDDWPQYCADIYFGLGKIYFHKNELEQSSIYFNKGL